MPNDNSKIDMSNIDSLQKSYGTNWDSSNEDTLHEWVSIGAYHIRLLEKAIEYNRKILRYNSILGIFYQH